MVQEDFGQGRIPGHQFPDIFKVSRIRGGGLLYITDGDDRRNFQKQPLKVTILGVAPANFIPLKLPWKFSFLENSTGTLKIIAKGQQVLLYMNGY